jgi:hypothetical protein
MGGLVNPFLVAPPPFNPADLFVGGFAGGWWDPSDLSTMFQDTAATTPVTTNNDPVARINDKSGNGNHLLQATAGKRPLYKTSGGIHWLEPDGSDDFLRATFAMSTTWDRMMAVRVTGGSFPKQMFGGVTANECLYVDGSVGLTMFNGSANGPDAVTAVGTDYVFTERWAATCQLAKDNNAYDSTPAIAAVNPGGLTLGASSSGADCLSFRFHGGWMVNKAMSGTEIANGRTYLGAKQLRAL